MAITAAYTRSDSLLLLNDSPEQIDFHVKTGDYFAHVATMLGFLEEAIQDGKFSEKDMELAKELRRDLQFMHSRYSISEKPAAAWVPIRKSGNILN